MVAGGKCGAGKPENALDSKDSLGEPARQEYNSD